jgi:hypothetical protein
VCGTKIINNTALINSITSIPMLSSLGAPFPNTTDQPSREALMECLNPHRGLVWDEEGKNSVTIGWLHSPQRLLAKIIMQNIWPIALHSVVPLNRARLIYVIINQVPFCMCKHNIMTMIELHEDSQVSLPYRGLVTKILKSKLPSILVNEPEDMPDGSFGMKTVLKSNAQLHRFLDPSELVPSAASEPSVASSSHFAPSSNPVRSMLTRITDQLRTMDDHFQALNSQMIEGFQTMDNQFQMLEADVAQIQINV